MCGSLVFPIPTVEERAGAMVLDKESLAAEAEEERRSATPISPPSDLGDEDLMPEPNGPQPPHPTKCSRPPPDANPLQCPPAVQCPQYPLTAGPLASPLPAEESSPHGEARPSEAELARDSEASSTMGTDAAARIERAL